MKDIILMGKNHNVDADQDGDRDRLGERIDKLREKGEELVRALRDVKL